MKLLDWIADTSSLTPHGFCLTWEPGLIWLYAVSDTITMLAYFSIPLALLWFVRRRRDLPHRWVAVLFASFIIACGTTHGLSILTLWIPAYHVEGMAKLITAVLSLATAAMLWPLVPKLLTLPSPGRMAALNDALRATIAEQDRTVILLGERKQMLRAAQETLRRSNADLERRVAERTAELVRVNETVGKNETRFRRVVEAAPNAIVMINAAGQIEMVNSQTERLFGYQRAELLGHAMEMLVPVRFRGHHPGLRSGFFTSPQSRPMGGQTVLFGRRKDGTEFEVEVGLNPIETEDGLMVLSAIVDISARVHLEKQLRQSQKMEAIGRLTAGIAHDFNNLLQALGGSLDLLHESLADRPEALQWVKIALRSALRGGELTGRLLSFSRQQVLTTRAIPVRKVLLEVQELISHMFETKARERNEIVVLPGPADLAVLADSAQLEAALINLAVNARDAMPSGGRLRISAYQADAEPDIVAAGRYVVISVADTGIGMDAATLAQACEPFYTTKGVKGTGLGLSMVQGFARQSGGEAHIISVVGEGTTVELWLPSACAVPAIEAPPLLPVALGGRVLLVDDSPDVLLTVGAFLRRAGIEVATAESGDMAIAALLTGRTFDVIVTDLAMPGINGLDLLEQARELDRFVAGMIITGYYDPEVHSNLNDIIVLRKPFNRAELLEQVTQLMRITQQARLHQGISASTHPAMKVEGRLRQEC